jgi:CheY-like chemotaxis protein
MTVKQNTILLVDDSPEDRHATTRAFRRTGMEAPIVYCADGDDALDYLYGRGDYARPGTSVRPSLILLDLNLPGTDGREVLEQLKNDSELCNIPIVILTTSSDPRDVNASYQAGANSYIQKPMDSDGLYDTVRNLKHYWLDTVILPQ